MDHELVAFLENKGKARLEIKKFIFDLRYALPADDIQANAILIPDVFQSQKKAGRIKYVRDRGTHGQWGDVSGEGVFYATLTAIPI
jgi:hypothetical protein